MRGFSRGACACVFLSVGLAPQKWKTVENYALIGLKGLVIMLPGVCVWIGALT